MESVTNAMESYLVRPNSTCRLCNTYKIKDESGP